MHMSLIFSNFIMKQKKNKVKNLHHAQLDFKSPKNS